MQFSPVTNRGGIIFRNAQTVNHIRPWTIVGKIITLSTELLNFITLGKDNKRLRVIIWQLILTISVKARGYP